MTPADAKDSGNERFRQNTLISKQIRSKNIGNSQSYNDLDLEGNFHVCGKSRKSLRFCLKFLTISSFSIVFYDGKFPTVVKRDVKNTPDHKNSPEMNELE